MTDDLMLRRNICDVRERIARASEIYAQKAGEAQSVTLVAATKTVPADRIAKLVELGVAEVGENRVQEYLDKKDGVRGARWHFIGTLQRNKAKYLVGQVALIQSVSSRELAIEIDRLAQNRGVVQPVLAELNVGDEASKTGARPDDIDGLIDFIRSLGGLELKGLMAVPPIGAPDAAYAAAKAAFDRHFGKADILSLGMSADFETAIRYGSNMVRVGTALFGQRT